MMHTSLCEYKVTYGNIIYILCTYVYPPSWACWDITTQANDYLVSAGNMTNTTVIMNFPPCVTLLTYLFPDGIKLELP